MKRKTNKKTGISLIVLVITIIVIIILAVAVILTLSNNNPIENAKEAVRANNAKVNQEKAMLLESQYELEKLKTSNNNEGTLQSQYIIQNLHNSSIELGDKVAYVPGVENGYTGKWRILGIENGHILLLSDFISNEKVSLTGIEGYNSAIATLDGECKPYGKGYGAVDARCIKLEDIDNLFGFNPSNPVNNGKPINFNKNYAYGANVTYTGKGNGQHSYSSNNTELGSGIDTTYANGITKFTKIDGTTLEDGEVYNAATTYYDYYITTKLENDGHALNKFFVTTWEPGNAIIFTTEKIFEMLNDVTNRNADISYFLATPTVWANQRVSWGLCAYKSNGIPYANTKSQITRSHYLWNATKGAGTCEHYVRAVVYLDPGVSLKNKNASGEWIIEF